MTSRATVFLIDSDDATCETVRELASTMNLACEVYASGKDFLEAYDRSRPGCVVVGLRLPDASGIEIQQSLNAGGDDIPVIFLTAYADLSIAVEVMRAGAVNFLEKPVHTRELWNSIEEAVALDRKRRRVRAWRQELAEWLKSLTAREREILDMVGQGKGTEEIASSLQIGLRSVQKHRARLTRKLGVSSLWDLMNVGLRAARGGEEDDGPASWPRPRARRMA